MVGNSAKVRLAFRVGVTGHRQVGSADASRLQERVASLLDDVRKAVEGVQSERDTKLLYQTEEPPLLQLVSPLAEGADRLVARAATARSWTLIVPLPFAQAEYEKDFPDAVDEFRKLLDQARRDTRGPQVVELDGARERRDYSYLEAGRFVFRHSDLLIAIWDGVPEKGVGGTGQIVREARTYGVPVVWIDSAPSHDCRLLLAKEPCQGTPYDPEVLATLVRDELMPIGPAEDAATAATNRSALTDYIDPAFVELDETIAPDFLYAGPFRANPPALARTIGGFFSWFIRLCSVGSGSSVGVSANTIRNADPPAGRDNSCVRSLYLAYQRADVLAVAYSNFHRSAYILIYLSGALALACAVAAIYFGGASLPILGVDTKYLFTGIELALLLFIVALLLCDHRGLWQERWLDYRLLAELFRESDIMAQLGRPFSHAWLSAHECDLPERAWVFRYYRAVMRVAGIVGGHYERDYLEACRTYLAETRIADQIDYHRRNANRSHLVNHRLKRVSEAFFVLTIACVVSKLFFSGLSHAILAGLWAGVFPAIAYGSFLIRNQAEFEIVVQRSQRMFNRLEERRKALLQLDEPLSEHLGREAMVTGSVMLQDAVDWASIFTVKESEAG